MAMLLVMNAQNSFLSKSGTVYMGEKAEILKIRLKDFISGFEGKRVFSKELHPMGDKFFGGEKTHSIPTSPDTLIIPELKPFVDNVVEKTRYDAFYKTTLESFLAREKVKAITLMGVETHTSVLFTAEELRNRGFEVKVIEPCTMSTDNYMHNYAISLMRNSLGVDVE